MNSQKCSIAIIFVATDESDDDSNWQNTANIQHPDDSSDADNNVKCADNTDKSEWDPSIRDIIHWIKGYHSPQALNVVITTYTLHEKSTQTESGEFVSLASENLELPTFEVGKDGFEYCKQQSHRAQN